MKYFFTLLLYQPLFNLLVWLYNVIPGDDIGIAIVVLTVLIKFLLYPIFTSSIRSQKSLQSLQPKMEELRKKYANNKEELAKATMELYKQNKVNPLSSCLPLLIQLPVFLALYWVLMDGLAGNTFTLLYPFVHDPGSFKPLAFGFLDLTKPSIPLAVLAGIAQFVQAKYMMVKPGPKVEGAKDENMMALMNKQMVYFMPILTVIIGARLPGGLSLYWFVSTAFTALQQWYIFRADRLHTKSIAEPTS